MWHARQEDIFELDFQFLFLRFLNLSKVDEKENVHSFVLEVDIASHAVDEAVSKLDLYLLMIGTMCMVVICTLQLWDSVFRYQN